MLLYAGVMLNPLLPNIPAFVGVRPDKRTFVPAIDQNANMIMKVFASGQIYKMVSESAKNKFYKHIDTKGKELFLKVVPETDVSRYLEANDICKYLQVNDVYTNLIIDGYPQHIYGDMMLLASEYVHGRLADLTIEDMKSIGMLVGKLHVVLRNLPDRKLIADNTRERMNLIKRRAELVKNGSEYGPQPDRIREMLIQEPKFFEMLSLEKGSQPLHGDLNYGNILITKNSGSAIVLDLEDAVHSQYHPEFELAFLIERFILAAETDTENIKKLSKALISSYLTQQDHTNDLFPFPLDACLRVLSLRSVLLLSEMEEKGIYVDSDEWHKFFSLFDKAVKHKYLLEEMKFII